MSEKLYINLEPQEGLKEYYEEIPEANTEQQYVILISNP